MDSSPLQNPADPDATFRKKAGKDHRGYAANITETVYTNGTLATEAVVSQEKFGKGGLL